MERDPLEKAVRVLRCMLDNPKPSWGTRELASQLALTPSTLHRTLSALARVGLVEQSDGDSYSLGLEFRRMAWQAVAAFPLEDVVRPCLQELTELTGESVLFAVYSHTRREMMFVAATEARLPLQYVVRRYEWMPVYAGASGLSILSALQPDTVRTVLDGVDLAPLTKETVTSREQLLAMIDAFRRRGYAYTRRQRIDDAVGISVPVRDGSGKVVGSATLTIPEPRFDESAAEELAQAVVRCGRQIEHRLGRRS